MSQQKQKRRRRELMRLHQSQRCGACGYPGATEVLTVALVGPKGGKTKRTTTVVRHRKCAPVVGGRSL